MKPMSLSTKSIIGVAAGTVLGFILLNVPGGWFRDDFLVNGLFYFLGTAYLTLIKVVIIPFVFSSLLLGIASASDVRQVGQIGGKSISIYLTTQVLAAAFGIAGGMLLQPGVGVNVTSVEVSAVSASAVNVSFVKSLLTMIPSNIVQSMANGNMIHVVIFATMMGIAMSMVGENARVMKGVVESFNHVMLRFVEIVMSLTPIGVFALMASTVVNMGYDVIVALAKYAVYEILLFIVFGAVVYTFILRVLAGVKLWPFIKKYLTVIAIPFSTSSSNATIPYNIKAVRELGVSNKVAAFNIPLGASINMDGSAIMQGFTAVFVAQLYGIDMSLEKIIIIVITATLATIGSPGMPGVVMATLVVVLQSVGFPLESIALIVAIDRFTDMFKTVLNVMGDAVCTVAVSKWVGEFDEKRYYASVDTDLTLDELDALEQQKA